MTLKLTNILKESSETDLKYFEIANKAFEKVFSKLENGNYKISKNDEDRYIINKFHKDLSIIFDFEDYSEVSNIRDVFGEYVITFRIGGDIDYVLTDGYSTFKNIFIHEYIHYLDIINNRVSKNPKIGKNNIDYVNSPQELNAYFTSLYKSLYDYKLLKFIVGKNDFNNEYNLENDGDLINMIIERDENEVFYDLSPENRKKYLKRIYKALEAINIKISKFKKNSIDNILDYLQKNLPNELENFGF
jgi:hypothetical protein